MTVREARAASALSLASRLAALLAFTASERAFLRERQWHRRCLMVVLSCCWVCLKPGVDCGAHF